KKKRKNTTASFF
ncbi:alpha-1,2-fucosyltransferase, partial [Helicobacter pylori]